MTQNSKLSDQGKSLPRVPDLLRVDANGYHITGTQPSFGDGSRDWAKNLTAPGQPAEKNGFLQGLATDAHSATGRVLAVAEERNAVLMRAVGQDTLVLMPAGQRVPENVEVHSYGKISIARPGEAPRFESQDLKRPGKAVEMER